MNGYLIALVGPSDDVAVVLVASETEVHQFIAANPPMPMDGADAVRTGPLADAMDVRGCGPSEPIGYGITKFEDGKPTKWCLYDSTVPLFPSPQEEWAVG